MLIGGDGFGRSSTARRRIGGKRAPSLQAQGSDGRHHQGSEASLVLPEAGREAAGEAGLGEKACPKKAAQRRGLTLTVAPQRAETFEVLQHQQEKSMSKHDSVTKRHRRPKSDKRVDYTARTMAAVKQLEQAAKLKAK